METLFKREDQKANDRVWKRMDLLVKKAQCEGKTSMHADVKRETKALEEQPVPQSTGSPA